MRTIVFGSLLLFVLQACGNASSPEYESGDGTARRVSIAYLKSLCRGVLHPVTEDLWIEGCVVGNDLYGEFPDALVVEDESGGIEVLIDAKRLYRTFDAGSTVSSTGSDRYAANCILPRQRITTVSNSDIIRINAVPVRSAMTG